MSVQVLLILMVIMMGTRLNSKCLGKPLQDSICPWLIFRCREILLIMLAMLILQVKTITLLYRAKLCRKQWPLPVKRLTYMLVAVLSKAIPMVLCILVAALSSLIRICMINWSRTIILLIKAIQLLIMVAWVAISLVAQSILTLQILTSMVSFKVAMLIIM